MHTDEKILLALAAIGLVVVVIMRGAVRAPNMTTSLPAEYADVPAYLGTATPIPFAFAPPVGNILPFTSAGEVGQSDNATADSWFNGACGCGMQ